MRPRARFLLPLASALGVLLAIGLVVRDSRPPPPNPPALPLPSAPFASYIAGDGLVEAQGGDIAVASPVPGIVAAVYVTWGEQVVAGTPLLALDSRDLQASLPPARAEVAAAQVHLDQARSLLALAQSVPDPRAISTEEMSRRRFAVADAAATLTLARARLGRIRHDIERRTVRARQPGRVLQINVRPGEQAGTGAAPLLVLGDETRLDVRVEVDQYDAARIDPRAAAIARVRDAPGMQTRLRFERIEPIVVPKRALSGQSTQRVDTRALQVIYSFDPASFPAYVGEQLDVYIDAPPPSPAPQSQSLRSPSPLAAAARG